MAEAIEPVESAEEPLTDDTKPGVVTRWTVKTMNDEVHYVTLPGHGRISYGRATHGQGADVRFYKNQTTKFYDAVLPNVFSIHSEIVKVERAPLSPGQQAAEDLRQERVSKAEERAAERVAEAIARKALYGTSDEDEPEPEPILKW